MYYLMLGKKLTGAGSPINTPAEKLPEPEIVTVNLIFWSDGFTIGEGPLRPYDDREGLRILDNLRNGYANNISEYKN